MSKRECMLILGMHRCGTSAMSGLLNDLGYSIGELIIEPSFDNPKGFFENESIVTFNDSLLLQLGVSWDTPFLLSEDGIDKLQTEDNLLDAEKILSQEFGNASKFLIKDPRISLLLPFWLLVFDKLSIESKAIVMFRSPITVAQSLTKRNNFSRQLSDTLYIEYLLRVERDSKSLSRVFVHYDDLINKPHDVVSSLIENLDLNIDKDGKSYHKAFDSIESKEGKTIIDTDLNTKDNSILSAISDKVYHNFSKSDTSEFSIINGRLYSQFRNLYNQELEDELLNRSTFAKILWDTGMGFNSVESINVAHNNDLLDFKIQISTGDKKVKLIKLFPTIGPVSIQVNQLEFYSPSGEKLDYTLKDNTTYSSPNFYAFKDDAPVFLIRFDRPQAIDNIVFKAQINAYSESISEKEIYTKIKPSNSLFGGMITVAIKHPIRLIKHLNADNFRILRRALKRESPQVILRNFKKLIIPSNVAESRVVQQKEDKNKIVGESTFSKITNSHAENEIITKSKRKRNLMKNVLYIFSSMPEYDKSSGGQRASKVIELLQEMSNVTIMVERAFDEKYRSYFADRGVRVLQFKDRGSLKVQKEKFNVLIYNKYRSFLDMQELKNENSDALLIMDTEDVAWVREERSLDVLEGMSRELVLKNKLVELDVYRQADILWAVTEPDSNAILQEIENADIRLVSNIHSIKAEQYKSSEKPRILFFGGFNHYPNRTALRVLVNEIWPIIKQSIPDAELVVAGSGGDDEVYTLTEGEGIRFIGFVEEDEVSSLYESMSMTIVPVVSGAGVKGKITEAISYRLPVITNDLGNEGINLIHKQSGFILEDWSDMAQSAIDILNDKYDIASITEKATDVLLQLTAPDVVRESIAESIYPQISLCVVTWNGIDLLKACIDSILKNTFYPNYRIIIHSNACTDGTQDYIRKLAMNDHRIIPILSPTNEVFVKPNNGMINYIPENDAVMLNNDITVEPGWLLAMHQAAYTSDKVGVVGAKLLYPDGTLQEFGSEIYDDGSGYNHGKYDTEPFSDPYSRIKAVGYVSGCAFYIKRSTIDKIGVLDTDFHPIYFEDSEYCYRAWKNDLYTVVTPESVIYHHEGATNGQDENVGLKKHQLKNRDTFLQKHGKDIPEIAKKIKNINKTR